MERRDFLRSVAALGLTELAVVACSSSNKELPPIPDKIPDDIVSEEELQQLREEFSLLASHYK
jgi:predicted component of type VI protein secretion system